MASDCAAGNLIDGEAQLDAVDLELAGVLVALSSKYRDDD